MRTLLGILVCGCAASAPPAAAPAPAAAAVSTPPSDDQVAMGNPSHATGDPDEGGEVTNLSGTGEGGGGVGEGTIGVGPIGTIGGGAGIGAARPTGAPHRVSVTPGTATITGALDPAIVRRIVLRNRLRLQYCYERELVKQPALAGKIVVRFTIGKDGMVITAATERGFDAEVDQCVTRTLGNLQFPAPTNGGIVEVTYPFTFAPSD